MDPYKGQIDQLLQEGVWNAMVIYREIQAAGYEGKTTILREYIAPKRALRAGRATVRFETKPGQQMQSDWGEIETVIGGQSRKVYFEVNQLGYLRRFHFWCTDSMDAEHTYEGLVRSLEYFGGVPQEVLVDNQKVAVVSNNGRGQVRFNERFLDLAGHYGFEAKACRPYRARTKGKDERMVGYIEHHFFVRYRAFESWAHLNQVAEQWLREEADQRRHGTVHEVVAERFEREVPTLAPLPARLSGQTVGVRIDLDDQVRVYEGESLVAQHRLQAVEQGWVTVPEHHTSLWQEALQVDQRPLKVYQEAAQWS